MKSHGGFAASCLKTKVKEWLDAGINGGPQALNLGTNGSYG